MGTLKALVGGSWVPILGGGGVNEVAVSPDVPTDPNVELWYDTDDPGIASFQPIQSRVFIGSTSVNLTSGAAAAAVSFDSEEFDTAGMHGPANLSRLTVPTGGAGLWLVGYTLSISNGPAGVGSRSTHMKVNGTANNNIANVEIGSPPANKHTAHSASVILQLNDGDYIEVYASQDSGSTLTMYAYPNARQSPNAFWATRLGLKV